MRAISVACVFAVCLEIGLLTSPVAASEGGAVAGPCACDTDVDNVGGTNAMDIDKVVNCINGSCAACLSSCDVDCDGDVDYVDAGVTTCAHQGFLNCCVNVQPGACFNGNMLPTCVNTTSHFCGFAGGTYVGNGTSCAEVPAVSTWGLIVMALLTVGAGSVVVVRKNARRA